MVDINSQDLLAWIERLTSRCLELNNALINFYQLNNYSELINWTPFSRPSRAVVLKIIPRRGSLELTEQQVTYAVHGAGITFLIADKEEVSFDYFPQPEDCCHPILGYWFLQRFINSTNPAIRVDSSLMDKLLTELLTAGKIALVHSPPSGFYLV